ncbi:MAG: ATP-binding cassette domain-containing protein [bacterium]|nr:ATP-binding cassette domain-containing protein [bacterium]
MSQSVLELSDVTKLYGDFTAVDRVSLSIPEGSIYGFLGPNGAGKTTTIRMILEIIKPTSGTIRVFDKPSALQVRDRIGYLPEEKGLYKKMKAWSIIAYFATLKGLDRRKAKRRAYELLEQFGLKDFADQKTEALSKGMGQKVQVLASIAHDPDLVILDEPFSGLDPVNQQVMEDVIRDMAVKGRTVLFSTHVMQHAERICDRLLLIARGRKMFDGTLDEAKRTLPRRVRIETDAAIQPLLALPDVIEAYAIDSDGMRVDDDAAAANGNAHWELEIRENADPQAILHHCFENGIRLRRFDHSDPSLHDVFVRMVGPDAMEASYR